MTNGYSSDPAARGRAGEHSAEAELPSFDFHRFLYHVQFGVRRFWLVGLILISLCAGALMFRAYRRYSPVYQCDAILTVNVDVSSTTNYYNTTTAKQMAATFPYILTSTQLVNLVQQDLGIGYLNAVVSTSAVEGTNLFTIRVSSADPQRAYDVLCSVLRTYPEIADYVIGATQLNLIAEPQVPVYPVNAMNLQRSALEGAAVGFLLFLVLLALYAALDLTVVGSHDMEQKFNGRCIAKIPYAGALGKDEIAIDIRDKNLNASFGESFRVLRHEVEKKAQKDGKKVLLVTSTSPNEGKSTVSVNLALALAQHGSKVLLIDCDLRKPALKYHMKYTGETPGLAAVLTRKVSFHDAVRVIPNTGLHVLFSSSAAENAADLYGSSVMDSFLKSLREAYDYIVLDTAPTAMISDTGALAQYADGLIYIVRQDYVFASNIREAVRQLSASGIEMLGFVLNITHKGGTSGRYGYGYYGYGAYGRYGRYGRYGHYGSRYGRYQTAGTAEGDAEAYSTDGEVSPEEIFPDQKQN